jgi:N-methylhydantoinase A/oxoprolinase/acetone carboxylase beta subunit/DUF917 family protein
MGMMSVERQESSSLIVPSYYIGIDIGGTNTDVALLSGEKVIETIKVLTTFEVKQGVVDAISLLLKKAKIESHDIHSVMLGTTHFVNTMLQNKGLNKVLVIRLGRPATTAVDPLIDWPEKLRQLIGSYCYVIYGGHEFNGKEISPLDLKKVKELALIAKAENIKAAAICGVFANVNAEHELAVKQALQEVHPEIHISLSHEVGGLNLLPRENATIINAALSDQFNNFYTGIKQALSELALSNASIYLSSNDGTLEQPEDIFPIFTYGSGTSNSIRGAMKIAGIHDAVVVDIGGTSTDVGGLKNGFPLDSGYDVRIGNEIEGIHCSFPAPLTRSCALGGGSIITVVPNGDIHIGPESVGFRLNSEAIIFGGEKLTVTDIAVAKGRLSLGDPAKVNKIDADFLEKADQLIHEKLAEMINQILPFLKYDKPVPLILVGGGALLIDQERLGALLHNHIHKIIIPQYAGYANAIGAAVAKVSGSFNNIVQYGDTADSREMSRKAAIESAVRQATTMAVKKGADAATVTVQNIEELPINYLPGGQTKLRVKVVGELLPDHRKKKFSDSSKEDNQQPVSAAIQDKQLSTENYSHEDEGLRDIQSEESNHSISQYNDLRHHIRKLNEENIVDIGIGSGILGSGGGGDTLMGQEIIKKALQDNATAHVIALENLPDDAFVVGVGIVGAPSVLSEKLLSKRESIEVINKMEQALGEKIGFILPVEIGGMNGLYPIYTAMQTAKIIIDADCMGRAFPGIQMVTPHIYGTVRCIAILANAQQACELTADNLQGLELQVRNKLMKMGGAVTMAYLPMRGKDAKNHCVTKSLSVAQKIGNSLRHVGNQDFSQMLNRSLAGTGYGPVEFLIKGKIIGLNRTIDQGFNKGWVIIMDDQHKRVIRIDFQNENLRAVDFNTNIVIAVVPKIITLIDNEFKPISCECLRMGLNVTALSLQVPKLLRTEKALAIVGPSAFNLEPLENLQASIKESIGAMLYGKRNTQTVAKETHEVQITRTNTFQ